MGPVLGNLDLYSGTLKLTHTLLCTKDPEYNTLKNPSYFVFLFDKCLKYYFYANH